MLFIFIKIILTTYLIYYFYKCKKLNGKKSYIIF